MENNKPNIIMLEPPQPGPPRVEPPNLKYLGQSFQASQAANNALSFHLSQSNEPLTESSKVESARLMSQRLGLSMEYTLANYDQISENITGISNNPQGTLEYIGNKFKAGSTYTKQARLWAELRDNPETERRPFIMQEIEALNNEMPPMDTSERSWLTDMAGATANMIPYTWEVGKYMVPGAVLALVTKGAAGKEQLAAGLSMAGSLLSATGHAISFKESHTLAKGIIFGDMMQLEDPEGNPINEEIARTMSGLVSVPYAAIELLSSKLLLTGNSALRGAVTKLTGGAFEKILLRSAARTVNSLGISGAYRTAANNVIRIGGNVLTTAAFGMTEEIFEEELQDIMQLSADEYAKQVTNELDDTGFLAITAPEVRERLLETLTETAKGVFLLQLPNFISSGVQAHRTHKNLTRKEVEAEAIQAEDNILDFYVKATPEQAAELEELQLAEVELQSFAIVDTKIDETTITATTATGTKAGSTTYEVSDDIVTITAMDVAEAQKVSTAQTMVQTLQNKFPDKRIVLSPEAAAVETIGRALEDLDTDLQLQNIRIDEATESIQIADKNIQELTDQIESLEENLSAEASAEEKVNLQTQIEQAQEQIGLEEESKTVSQTTLEEAQAAKIDLAEAPVKPIKDMTAEEFDRIIQFPIDEKKRFVNTPKGQKLKADIAVQTTFTEENLSLAVDLVEMAANAKGITPAAWLDQSVKGIEQGDQRGRGSVLFEKEAKVIIRLTEKSDFTTWVHELAHILRRQLTGKELAVATVWAEGQTGDIVKGGAWTARMEEAFAAAFEKYIAEGQTEHKEMKTIFDKLAEFMRAVYDSLKHLPEITPEIRAVFENQLSPTRITQLEKGTATEAAGELFQPDYLKEIKKAVSKGFEVSEEILQQFPKEKWATEELQKRKENQEKLETFDWLADMANRAKNVDDFIEEAQLGFFDEIDQLKGKDEAWLREFHDIATRDQEITDINTGNKRWAAGLDDDYIKNIITEASRDIKRARDIGLPVSVILAGARFKSKETISDTQVQIIKKTFQNNPSAYRQVVADFIGDIEEARLVDLERDISTEIGIEEDIPIDKFIKTRLSLAENIDDITTKKQIQRGTISDKDLNKILKDTSKELKSSDVEVKKLESDLQEQDRLLAERLRKIVDIREREKQAAKDEKRQAVKEAISKEKARRTALIKKQKDLKKVKDQIKKLGKQITKNIPASVDISYVGLIQEIQAKVDPKFRRKDKLTEKQFLRKYYEDNPEIAAVLPKEFISQLQAKSLNEWDIGELEYLKAKIDQLKAAGKAKKALKDAIDKEIIKETAIAVEAQIRQGKEVDLKEYGLGEGLTLKDKVLANVLKTFRPSRVADWLDGGADYKGPVVRLVIDEVNVAYDNELRQKHRRQTNFKNEMIRLGITNKDFERLVDIRGQKVSIDEIMDVYAGYLNEKKRAALEGAGNKITQEIHDEMIDHLSDTEKQFADFIIQEYAENYDRLKAAFMEDKNIDIGREENYTPIRRSFWGLSADEVDVVQELIGRQQFGKAASIQKKFGERRLEISAENQSEITLGLVAAWHGEVAKQEHYINNAAVVKKMNAVLNHRNVKAAAKDMGRTAHLQNLQDYSKRYANPSIYKSVKGWDSAVKILKNNSAIAYLAYNMVTMTKQLPSLIYYTAYSSPADIMAAMVQIRPGKGWKEARATMDKYAPQISYGRSMEAYIESLKQKGKSKTLNLINKIGLEGMRGIEFFDKMTVTAGWTSVYNKHLRNGSGEVEAGRLATQATLHSQPAAGAKDVAALYADDNFLTVFLQFSNQLNQLWNTIAWDAPQAFKNKHFLKGAGMYSGIMFTSVLMWMISNRRLPEDKEDYIDVFTDQFFSIMPGLGKTMGNYIDGYDLSIPIIAPLKAGSTAISLGKRAFSGQDITDVQVERLLLDIYEGVAISTGIPYTEITRIYKGFKNGKPFQYIVFGGELND